MSDAQVNDSTKLAASNSLIGRELLGPNYQNVRKERRGRSERGCRDREGQSGALCVFGRELKNRCRALGQGWPRRQSGCRVVVRAVRAHSPGPAMASISDYVSGTLRTPTAAAARPKSPQRQEERNRRREEVAAVRIQSAYRSFSQRKSFRSMQLAVQVVQKWVRRLLAKKEYERLLKARKREQAFDLLMKRHREMMQGMAADYRELEGMEAYQLMAYNRRREAAATLIQKYVRRWRARTRFLRDRNRMALQRGAGVNQRVYDSLWGRRGVALSDEERSQDDRIRALAARLRGDDDGAGVRDREEAEERAAAAAQRSEIFADGRVRVAEGRRAMLEQQVHDRVLAHKMAGRVPAPTDEVAELDERLGRLMGERRERLKEDAQSLMRRRRRRMQLTVLRENLFDSSWSLEELPKGMRAHQFPLPPEESGRMAKAAQEHALALAEISDAWWRPLGRFRGTEVAAGEDRAALGRLEAREAARRARWEREERALRARPRVEDLERAVRDRLGVRTAALLARDEEREGDVGAGGEAGETAEAVAAA